MSLRKNKFTKKDKLFMNLALNLASDRLGLTGENPSVGCVIVKNNTIISTGQTGLNGRPHAEYNAIKSCKKNLTGSTIYVSLEPCSHYGKTPPCTNIIVKSKVKKVIFSIEDIDTRTKFKSIKIFKRKKIQVKYGLLKNDAKEIYKSYIYNKKKKLPFVTGKLAVSNDHYISSNNVKKITNEYSNNITHLLRYKNDSILISNKTLNNDNPKLNCRIAGLSKFSPKRIILDKNLSIKETSFIFRTVNKNNTIIFYKSGTEKKIKLLRNKGVKLIQLKTNMNNFFDLKTILNKIYYLGCRNLLVEGGKTLTGSFLKHMLFNQFYLFRSSKRLNKSGKLNVFTELNHLFFKYRKKSKINTFTGNDVVYLYLK